jgi:hypothetical protein
MLGGKRKGRFGLMAVATLLAALVALSTPRAALAAEGASSNYLPGAYGNFGVALAPAPGVYFQNDLFYYNADAQRAVLSGLVDVTLDTQIYVDLVTAVWVPDYRIFGAQFAAGVFVPFINAELSGSVTVPIVGTVSRSGSRFDVGDIAFMPASLFWAINESLHVNLYEAITTPTGPYTTSRVLNIGRNYFSFDTVMAITWFNQSSGTEISATPGIMINTENTATNYRTGTEFHMDWMVNQFFSPTFALGVHGYVYQQLSGDSGSGAILGDFRGEAYAVGPALMWVPIIDGKPVKLMAKFMHEFGVQRRFEGYWAQVEFGFQF